MWPRGCFAKGAFSQIDPALFSEASLSVASCAPAAMPRQTNALKSTPTRATSWPARIWPTAALFSPRKAENVAWHCGLVTWPSLSFQWWQVEKVNPIKLYEENKVIAGFSLLNLLFKQGRAGLIRGVVDKLIGLYNQKKIKPVVDSLWALEEVRMVISPQRIISSF